MVEYKKLSDIPGYENAVEYMLSSEGKVYSSKVRKNDKHGYFVMSVSDYYKEIKGSKDSKGYLCLDIRSSNSIKKYPKIHRLIAEAFLPNPDNLSQVNHIDGDKTNNNINKLEWVSNKENRVHAIKNGLQNFINYGIGQYDLDENLIDTFNTAEEALIKLGKPPHSGNIGRVIRGKRKTAYGYVWKQINSSTTIETELDA